PATFIEQLFGLVASQPTFELLHVGRVVMQSRKWHLMCTPEPFHLVPVDFLGTGPALWTAQDNHRPPRSCEFAVLARFLLDAAYFQDTLLHGGGHFLMHDFRIIPFHEVRRPAVTLEKVFQLFVRDAREQCWVIDLVAVEV